MDRRRRLLTEKYSEPAHNPALRGLRGKVKKITLHPGVVSIAGSRVRGESTEDLDIIVSLPDGMESQIKKTIEDVLGDADVKVSDGRDESRLPLWDLALIPHRPLGLVAARQLEGGPGSGHHGHKGVKGQRGGSVAGGGEWGMPADPEKRMVALEEEFGEYSEERLEEIVDENWDGELSEFESAVQEYVYGGDINIAREKIQSLTDNADESFQKQRRLTEWYIRGEHGDKVSLYHNSREGLGGKAARPLTSFTDLDEPQREFGDFFYAVDVPATAIIASNVTMPRVFEGMYGGEGEFISGLSVSSPRISLQIEPSDYEEAKKSFSKSDIPVGLDKKQGDAFMRLVMLMVNNGMSRVVAYIVARQMLPSLKRKKS